MVENFIETAKRVLAQEAEALTTLSNSIDSSFGEACKLILDCKGRVIVTGMGKSGHVGQKIAASLTSTGIPAHFLHPAEGFHGDLGVIHRSDLLLGLSFSGETQEIIDLLGPVKHLGVDVISITSRKDSTLARHSKVVLSLGTAREADSHNLVPTTSTTLTLALGDALTVALMEAREFTPEDFAVFHPKGMLGKRLTLQVESLLHGEKTNPVIHDNASFDAALEVITRYTLGGTSIVGETGELVGIITDGDIRRIIKKMVSHGGTVVDAMATPVKEIMTIDPTYIHSYTLAYDALKLMENHKPSPIFLLPVVNEYKKPVGMLHLHSLVQAGFKSGNGEK